MGDVEVALWSRSRWPTSKWRARSRSAICAVLDAARAPDDTLPANILVRVDEAYPFGERENFPYKAWLQERGLFIAALRARPMPSADEVAACEVARDLIEDGDPDPAILAKLLEQAPNRIARKCPACGSLPGVECVVIKESPGGRLYVDEYLHVPHHARLHLDAGPLFTARTP